MTDDDVITQLGGIPENKAHCSLLGINGLRAAIADYLVKTNHKKYSERIKIYQQAGYDIPKHREEIVELLNGKCESPKILEIGTGKGHLAMALSGKGYACMATDFSDDELYFARLNAIFYQLDDKIEFMKQDALQLEFPNESFDVVFNVVMLHHIEKVEAALSEMLRVCRHSGSIFISDLNEKGKNIIKTLMEQDGKDHADLGWEMEKIKKWFESRNCSVKIHEMECETAVAVTKN